MLSFIFKPKWKHRNPVKRLRGIQELSAGNDKQHEILVEIATNDLDPRVRLKAVEKICDLNSIDHIISTEVDDIVRSTAQNRYYSLISGTATDSPPDVVTGRYKIVDDSEDEDLKRFIIHHSPDEKLQFTALQALVNVDDIARIAISAPNLKVREAAARMAEQMANKITSASTPKAVSAVDSEQPKPESESKETIANLAAEQTKAQLRAEMKVKPKPPKGELPNFRSSGQSLQIDDDSASALQALLDQKLASRNN